MLALGLVAVTLVAMVALGLLVGAQSGRSRAQAAADLAALAGAQQLTGTVRGSADVAAACGVAREAAQRNGGVLRECADEGGGVLNVAVERATPVGQARAVARAGPATAR